MSLGLIKHWLLHHWDLWVKHLVFEGRATFFFKPDLCFLEPVIKTESRWTLHNLIQLVSIRTILNAHDLSVNFPSCLKVLLQFILQLLFGLHVFNRDELLSWVLFLSWSAASSFCFLGAVVIANLLKSWIVLHIKVDLLFSFHLFPRVFKGAS